MGMEEEALQRRQAGDRTRRAVDPVTHYLVMQARQMNPNLMCTAGTNANFQVAEEADLLDDPISSQSGAAGPDLRGHARSPDWIARDRAHNAALRLLHTAVRERQIRLLNHAIVELFCKRLVGVIRPRYGQHAAGLPIQTMHNAGPQIAVYRR